MHLQRAAQSSIVGVWPWTVFSAQGGFLPCGDKPDGQGYRVFYDWEARRIVLWSSGAGVTKRWRVASHSTSERSRWHGMDRWHQLACIVTSVVGNGIFTADRFSCIMHSSSSLPFLLLLLLLLLQFVDKWCACVRRAMKRDSALCRTVRLPNVLTTVDAEASWGQPVPRYRGYRPLFTSPWISEAHISFSSTRPTSAPLHLCRPLASVSSDKRQWCVRVIWSILS